MTSTSNRRQQNTAATVIDHAIDLKNSHGSSYASNYLRNQRIHEDTIQRVLFGHWCDHRVQDCQSSPHKA
jgi:hypothetical protein